MQKLSPKLVLQSYKTCLQNYKKVLRNEIRNYELVRTNSGGFVLVPIDAQGDYFNDVVWEVDAKSKMQTVDEHVFVKSRWVLCNKGDGQDPDLRARLVACEINKGDK